MHNVVWYCGVIVESLRQSCVVMVGLSTVVVFKTFFVFISHGFYARVWGTFSTAKTVYFNLLGDLFYSSSTPPTTRTKLKFLNSYSY